MNSQQYLYCAVCGHAVENAAFAYLLTTNPATSRLTILRWDKTLSQTVQTRAACEPEHALEMIAHWLASGTLSFNFAQTAPCRSSRRAANPSAIQSLPPHEPSSPIGELTVDRKSLQGVLKNNPQALGTILDSLLEALQRDRNMGPVAVPTLGKDRCHNAA